MALEVVPDLLGRVEFRGILGKELGLQAGMAVQHLPDRRPLVDLALVPQQDDGTLSWFSLKWRTGLPELHLSGRPSPGIERCFLSACSRLRREGFIA